MMVVPPKIANQKLTWLKLYNTVNSPTKLNVPGKATDAKTKIINIEVNFGVCERIPPISLIFLVSYLLKIISAAKNNPTITKPCAIICETAPLNPSRVKV